MPDLGLRDQVQNRIDHAQAGPQDRDQGDLLAYIEWPVVSVSGVRTRLGWTAKLLVAS